MRQVPRLRGGLSPTYGCISLWSESTYMLAVDGGKIEIPDPQAWSVVLMEERFDPNPSWTHDTPISYTSMVADGVRVVPPNPAQSTDVNYPVFIPTIPRILDALMDQVRRQVVNFNDGGHRPDVHLKCFVRYLHLETPQQRERVLSELAERNWGLMEMIIALYKRKPLLSLDSLKIGDD
jgi:hypothetical protein